MNDNSNGNLVTLTKPIKYEVVSEKERFKTENDEETNILGWHEMILLSHDLEAVHYIGVERNEGVLKSVEYRHAQAEDFWELITHGSYECKGFIDLDSKQAKYLFAGAEWEDAEEEETDWEKAYNFFMDIIDQFKDTKKQEEYRCVINTIYKDFAHKRDLVGS
tara:strand:+ start:1105 stop:1593 length:489 start_codon:yes stop_codon:yes gene_type:complete